MKLDLSDSMVRDMADRNHVPTETWGHSMNQGRLVLEGVLCDMCGERWPCETRKELRRLGVTP